MYELIYMNDIKVVSQISIFKAFKSQLEVFRDDWGCLEVIGNGCCCFRLIEGLSGMIGVGGGWLVMAFGACMWFGKLHTAT